MQIGKLSAGILNMKIDTFDSRTTPSEGTIPGLNIAVGNQLGLHSSGKGKSSKKKVKVQYFNKFWDSQFYQTPQSLSCFTRHNSEYFQNKNKSADKYVGRMHREGADAK